MKPECIITYDGRVEWRLPNDQLHREDGPAVEYRNGDKSWWINGNMIKSDKINSHKNNDKPQLINKSTNIKIQQLSKRLIELE